MNPHTVCRCGLCDDCKQRAQVAVASYVLRHQKQNKRSGSPKNPRERRYVHGQVIRLLVMAGLADEELLPTEQVVRSEWGRAMRTRQG